MSYRSDEDNTLVWALSGMVSTVIFSDAYSAILKLLEFEPQYAWNFAADYLLQGRQNIESFYGVCIGLVVDYLIGSANRFLIGLVLEWRGFKYYWLKGAGVALSNWLALGIMGQIVPELFTYHLTPLNYFTYIFSYSIWHGHRLFYREIFQVNALMGNTLYLKHNRIDGLRLQIKEISGQPCLVRCTAYLPHH